MGVVKKFVFKSLAISIIGVAAFTMVIGSLSTSDHVGIGATSAQASTPAADAALASLRLQVDTSTVTPQVRSLLSNWLGYAQAYFANNNDTNGCGALGTFRQLVTIYRNYYPSLQPYADSWIAQTDAIKALVPC